MTDYVHLIGAENVRAAGSDMREAAQEMRNAAAAMTEAFHQHQRFMENWLMEFKQALEQVQPKEGSHD